MEASRQLPLVNPSLLLRGTTVASSDVIVGEIKVGNSLEKRSNELPQIYIIEYTRYCNMGAKCC